jgi:hypothetical protein
MEKGNMVTKNNGEEPKKASKSKQIVRKAVVSKTGVEVREAYCRVCMKTKAVKENFLLATDTFLDRNGFMSVCKSCINEIYARFYETEKNVDKTILRMCRLLNVRYDENALAALKSQINTYAEKGTEFSNVFGVYKGKLTSVQSTEIGKRQDEDLGFVEPMRSVIITNPLDDDEDSAAELKQFWGDNFNRDDYSWLESEMAAWKKTHRVDSRSEESLLRLIVLKLFDIRRKRNEGDDTTALEKAFQELLKTSALSPALSNQANQGKSLDTFGMWIKDIEQFEPAEWYADKDMFRDISNVENYYLDYFVKPLKNFIYSSKDFTITDDDSQDIDFNEIEEDDINGDKSSSVSE